MDASSLIVLARVDALEALHQVCGATAPSPAVFEEVVVVGEQLGKNDVISKTEQFDRTTVVKRLLQEAIQEWKLACTLRRYREDRITKERAAEMAGVSIYEVIDSARREGVPTPLTVNEVLEEIKRLVPSRHAVAHRMRGTLILKLSGGLEQLTKTL